MRQVGDDLGLRVVVSLDGVPFAQIDHAGLPQVLDDVGVLGRLALAGVDPKQGTVCGSRRRRKQGEDRGRKECSMKESVIQ